MDEMTTVTLFQMLLEALQHNVFHSIPIQMNIKIIQGKK